MFCGARTRRGGRCRRYPLAGKRRCALHGGHSTGPRNWRASVGAMVEGRKRKIELLHRMGLRAPGGRPPRGMTSTEAYNRRLFTDLLQQVDEEKARSRGESTPMS